MSIRWQADIALNAAQEHVHRMPARLLLGSATLIALLLSACSRADGPPYETPAQAYRHWDDRFVAASGLPLPWRPYPCTVEKEEEFRGETFKVLESLPTDECVHMTPRRRWRGLWNNEFEGSQFCADARTDCSYRGARPMIWMDAWPEFPPDGKLYRVEFEGRRTIFLGSYGHMGMFDHAIILDRMLSMKEVARGGQAAAQGGFPDGSDSVPGDGSNSAARR